MLWDKTKYLIRTSQGEGNVRTGAMHGLIQHLIVCPQSADTVWSLLIADKDNDVIYACEDVEGRLDEREGIPVGQDKPEPLSIKIYDTTANEPFEVIFKVKEVR